MKVLFVNSTYNHTLVLTKPKVAITQRIIVYPLWITRHQCAYIVIFLVCKPGLNIGMTSLTTGILTRPDDKMF